MKTKFLSIVLMVAVCLGLLLVPAVSTTLAGPLTAGHVITPSATKVGFSTPFTVDVSLDNSANDDVNTVGAMINFTPSLISVTGVVINPLWTLPTGNTSDNVKGTIDIAAGIMGSSSSASSIPVATVYMVSNGAAISGIANIDIVSQPGVRESDILTVANGSILDWTMVVNATVKVGKAELTVDVSPAKGDVNIGGVGIPASYPNVTKWDWDTVVTVTATNAAAGWQFDSWSGDLGGGASPETITMSVDRSVTANFVELAPVLNVAPTALSFQVNEGQNPLDQTFDVSNTGGGTVHWAAAPRPVLTPGDNWTYFNTYFPMPLYNPALPGSYNNTLTLDVTGISGCDYTAVANFLPAPPHMLMGAQRTMLGGLPIVVWDAAVTIDQQTLVWDQLIVNASIIMGPPPWATALIPVNYNYNQCEHGWPYSMGKTWTYDVNILNPPPVGWINHTGNTAMVTAYTNTVTMTGAPLGMMCYEVTHFDSNMTMYQQQYWNDGVKSFVFMWDAGLFDNPTVGGALDVRVLLGTNFAPVPPAGPPSWISVNPVEGCLVGNVAVSGLDTVTVSIDSANLSEGNYTGIINVTDPCCSVVPVAVDLTVKPATSISVCRNLPGNALMTNQTYVGDTFDVWVNFTSPVDGFNSIGLTDTAPDGWIVEVNKTWCTPNAYAVQKWGNEAEILWAGDPGGYAKGTNFSARYTVTVPVTATPGINTWQLCPNSDMAWLEYYFGEEGPYRSCILCENEMLITVPGDVTGETRDVNANELSDVDVMLLKAIEGYLRSDSSTPLYENTAYRTGMYFEHSTKALYYEINMTDMTMLPDKWIDLTTPALLSAGHVFDFEGNYGLVPRACTMSYSLKSVNLWLFNVTGHPEWKLDEWKAMDSIHSWQFPS